ncbi:hypothetical protein [Corynebacterium callunae]|uniref:Uncharacterized protein n=1 Tax=Corynebacterium callunae DSM 20147 TaxID=1121353 RepID=M1UP88_9CORY|nr:hypothetical protein [Corynebacterium callunae]AGG68094.1 hypothetical protein H924_13525 [Corynebacterium callunae DSM 20147]
MTTANGQWQEVKDLVNDHIDELKTMSHTDIKEFAKEHKLMTKSGFPKLKTVLKTKGIDYEALRDEASQQRAEDLEARAETIADEAKNGPEIRLHSAAIDRDGQGSFAIVDSSSQAVWYGKFFDDDRIWTKGDPVSAEQSAADKAVWIAGKAVALSGASAGSLILGVTHPDLDVDELVRAGVRNNVAVTIVFEEDSFAVSMAETPGFMKWQEYDLQQLLDLGDDEDES